MKCKSLFPGKTEETISGGKNRKYFKMSSFFSQEIGFAFYTNCLGHNLHEMSAYEMSMSIFVEK